MRRLPRQTYRARQGLLGYLAVACLGLAAAFSAGCGQDDASSPSQPGPGGKGPAFGPEGRLLSPEGRATEAGPRMSAREILSAMVATYQRASRYADKGRVEVRFQVRGRPDGEDGKFTVAVDRASKKIRVDVYGGVLVSDGEKLRAQMRTVPDQVLEREAPSEVTVASIYPDQNLAEAMSGPTQAFSWLPVQLILLLTEDPLKTLLHGAEEPGLIEPAAIGQNECYRVRIHRPDGQAVFWIDRKTYVLRRFEFPTAAAQGMYAQALRVGPEQIRGLSVVAELEDVELDGQINPEVFEFVMPTEGKSVEHFVLGDAQSLGQPAPEFSFVDLEGKPVTHLSLAGKIAVIDFWATWCDPCRRTLPELDEVYQKYKDNDKVAFLAVSVDATDASAGQPAVEDKVLQETFKKWGVTVPIARDPELHAGTLFNVVAIPSMFILGSDGMVQERRTGLAPPGVAAAERISTMLDKLLAGEAIYTEALQEYQDVRKAQNEEFVEFVGKCVERDLYLHPMLMRQELTRAEIAQRTDPESLKLTQLWSCTELAAPGNILVVPPQADGPPRLLVIDVGTSVAEIGPNGAVDTMHQLELPEGQFVAFLRTAAGADGKRYFAGSASGAQQLYLTDDGFKPLLSYPKDALENRHAGIADLRFGDLDGNGTLEMYVAYLGDVGVQYVSLDGERTSVNRSLSNVLRVAVLPPDADGHANLLCTNELGTLVTLNAKAERQGDDLGVPDLPIHWIWSDDLDDDGQPELCGLSLKEEGDLVAVGLNLQGKVLWEYPLPHGLHQYPIEPVTTGQVLADGPRQWLLPAADGSIHVLAADGTLVDRFNYGAPPTGLATAQWDGKRVLLVATGQSVDAWQVEGLEAPKPKSKP